MKATCPICKKEYTLRTDGCLPKHTISIKGWRPWPNGVYAPSSPEHKVVIQKRECRMSGKKPDAL